uniref:Uncharacterized protein n=1 Tax=Escherichia coli TaxID=562 RepID=A0A7L8K9X4_ECOLX|nr:hypothetical protein [Escherichia coli]UCK65497.1 hypothetical protein [Providencia rettgeri]
MPEIPPTPFPFFPQICPLLVGFHQRKSASLIISVALAGYIQSPDS